MTDAGGHFTWIKASVVSLMLCQYFVGVGRTTTTFCTNSSSSFLSAYSSQPFSFQNFPTFFIPKFPNVSQRQIYLISPLKCNFENFPRFEMGQCLLNLTPLKLNFSIPLFSFSIRRCTTLHQMTSSLPDLNEIPELSQSPETNWLGIDEIPQSPEANWVGLDDIAPTDFGVFETEIETPIMDELVEVEVNIFDLNLPLEGRKKELTDVERLAAYESLLEKSVNGKLRRAATREVAVTFGVGIRTIQRLWKRARDSGSRNHVKFRVGNCGRKRVQCDLERIRDIPLRNRTTIHSLACALGVSRRYLQKKLKEGVIKRHTNSIKPSLTPNNHRSRINYCLSNVDPTTVPLQPAFNDMENTIHIDEKWFYLTKKTQNYYLLAGENDPVRIIRNSNYIPKVMFLAAVARPRYDSNGICTFDGKIGIFPLVQNVAAVRSSQNRPRGTIEVKPIANITRTVIREFLIGKILPAIASKWPRESIMDQILIQQDNAKTHIHTDDVEFLRAVEESGLNLCLVCQPPNSPDLNVLDLGFFRAIQSLQSRECAKSLVELVGAVEDAYETFCIKKSNCIFLTLQTCMVEVMKRLGSNIYKIPHMKKNTLARLESLPKRLECCPDIYANALAHVSLMHGSGFCDGMQDAAL